MKKKIAKDRFYFTTSTEKKTGNILLDIYRIQPLGQPIKLDRIYFPVDQFNSDNLTDFLRKRHGNEALRIRHYVSGSKYIHRDFITNNKDRDNNGSGISILSSSQFPARDIDPIKYLNLQKERDIEILNVKNELNKIKIEQPLTLVKIEKEKAEIEIMKQESKIKLKQMENDLDSPNYSDILKKFLFSVATEKDHPMNKIIMALARLSIFAGVQKSKKNNLEKKLGKKIKVGKKHD